MNSNSDNGNLTDRDPEELFCLKWNDFTVSNYLIMYLVASQKIWRHFCSFSKKSSNQYKTKNHVSLWLDEFFHFVYILNLKTSLKNPRKSYFQDNVMATMSDIRQEEDFFDVTSPREEKS